MTANCEANSVWLCSDNQQYDRVLVMKYWLACVCDDSIDVLQWRDVKLLVLCVCVVGKPVGLYVYESSIVVWQQPTT